MAAKKRARRISTSRARQGRNGHAQDIGGRDRCNLPFTDATSGRSHPLRYRGARAFAGRSFGDVGPYERITARATIALNPSDDRNAVITDLAQAPRGADGKVEAITDVVILRPADPARGNGTL